MSGKWEYGNNIGFVVVLVIGICIYTYVYSFETFRTFAPGFFAVLLAFSRVSAQTDSLRNGGTGKNGKTC